MPARPHLSIRAERRGRMEMIGGFAIMNLDSIKVIAICKRYTEILGGTLEIDVRGIPDDE
jgi:hypothetical protein